LGLGQRLFRPTDSQALDDVHGRFMVFRLREKGQQGGQVWDSETIPTTLAVSSSGRKNPVVGLLMMA
jgi:hypothetical protein